MIEVTTQEQFEDIILENDTVLVGIYTDYCAPCKKMKADVLPKIDGEITIVMISLKPNYFLPERKLFDEI